MFNAGKENIYKINNQAAKFVLPLFQIRDWELLARTFVAEELQVSTIQ